MRSSASRRAALLGGALALLLTLAGCGGGAKLAATKMTLELAYPPTGDPTAALTGQAGAAPHGKSVACRLTAGHRTLGSAKANADGSFNVPLDASAFPLNDLPKSVGDLNKRVECHASGGPWVAPLRPPRVAIG